jgi:hypothetical protein
MKKTLSKPPFHPSAFRLHPSAFILCLPSSLTVGLLPVPARREKNETASS